ITGWGGPMAGVMAHEFGHILQYKNGISAEDKELHLLCAETIPRAEGRARVRPLPGERLPRPRAVSRARRLAVGWSPRHRLRPAPGCRADSGSLQRSQPSGSPIEFGGQALIDVSASVGAAVY